MLSHKLRAASAQAAGSIDYTNWTQVAGSANPASFASWVSYTGPAYSASLGMYAIAHSSAIYTSTDNGSSWQIRDVVFSSTSTALSMFSIIWTGSKFVVAGGANNADDNSAGQPLTIESTDGVNWLPQGPNYMLDGTLGVGAVNVYIPWLSKYAEFCVSTCALSSDGVTNTSSTFLQDNATMQNVRPIAAFADITSQKIVMVGTQIIQSLNGSGNTGLVCTSSDGVNWTYLPSQSAVFAVVSSGSLWVTAGAAGSILTSSDGLAWTARTSGTLNKLSGLTWTGSLFVAVGASGTILTSPDGVTWTARTSGTTNNLRNVSWVNGILVATGNTGTIVTSSDGVTWTVRTSGSTSNLTGIAGNGSTIVVTGRAGTICTSPDGVTWTTRTSNTGYGLAQVNWQGTRFVAYGQMGVALASSDGVTWSFVRGDSNSAGLAEIGSAGGMRGIAYGAGKYVLTSSTYPRVYTSTDGILWSGQDAGIAGFRGMGYANGLFVATNYNNDTTTSLYTSPDGAVWTARTIPTSSSVWYQVAGNGSLIVTVGSTGKIITSPDGVTWTSRSSGTTQTLYGCVWDGTRFVATGGGISTGALLSSPDGVTWTNLVAPLNAVPGGGISYANGQYMCSSAPNTGSGFIFKSVDAVTWTYSLIPNATYVSSGANYFASSKKNGYDSVTDTMALVSGSAYTFNRVTNGGVDFIPGTQTRLTAPDMASTVYGNGLFVTIGPVNVSSQIYTSTDAITWTRRTSGSTAVLNDITWTGTQFIVVGNSGTILTSPDGITWTTRTSGTTVNINSIASSGTLNVAFTSNATIGGLLYTQCLSSADGVTWSTTVMSGFWGVIVTVLWDGAQFVATGQVGCWVSANGVSWTAKNESPQFGNTPTYASSLGLYVIPSALGRVYTSTDLVAWTPRTVDGVSTFNQMEWNGSVFVAIGTLNGVIYSSPDGITWTARSSGTTNSLSAITWGAGLFVVTGGASTILTSPDGITWTTRTVPGASATLFGVAWSGSKFVVSFSPSEVLTSPDGITWTRSSSTGGALFTRPIWTGSAFMGVSSRSVYSSADGITWTSVTATPNTAGALVGIAYSGSVYIATGSLGGIYRSTNGTTWSFIDAGLGNGPALQGAFWDGSKFIVCGAGKTILTSADGSSWASVYPMSAFPAAAGAVQFDGTTYSRVSGGAASISTDLETWTVVKTTNANTYPIRNTGSSNLTNRSAFANISLTPDYALLLTSAGEIFKATK